MDVEFKEKIVEYVYGFLITFCYLNSIAIAELFWNDFDEREKRMILGLLNSFEIKYKEKTITPNEYSLENIRKKLDW